MNNTRCKTCKHWERLTEASDVRYYGPYAGNCASDKFVYGDGNVPADSLVYYDNEGYHADFVTGEDFGCIHWETKR